MTLAELIIDTFRENIEKDPTCSRLLEKIEQGSATYEDAQDFAVAVGELLGDIYGQENLEALLAEGVDVILRPFGEEYRQVSEATAKVQEAVNKGAGINLNPVVPEQNTDRAEGLYKVLQGEKFLDPMQLLQEACINYAQSIVDDFARKNMDAHFGAGYDPKIRRLLAGNCCAWCARLGGTYNYADVKETGNDVYRRHRHCRCKVLFEEDGTYQDVHTKKMVDRAEAERRIKMAEDSNDEIGDDKNLRIARVKQIQREQEMFDDVAFGRRTMSRGDNTIKGNVLNRLVHRKTGELDEDEYALGKIYWEKLKSIRLKPGEYDYLAEEFDNNLTAEEKKQAFVQQEVGNYIYYAIHLGHNVYKFYRRVRIK